MSKTKNHSLHSFTLALAFVAKVCGCYANNERLDCAALTTLGPPSVEPAPPPPIGPCYMDTTSPA